MKLTRTDFDDADVLSWWTAAYRSGTLVCDTLFQSPVWNRLWFEYFVRDDPRRQLYLIKIEDDSGIVALAPLFLQTRNAGPLTAWRYLLFLGDPLAQYTDLITTQQDMAALWHGIQQHIDDTLSGAWIELHNVLPDATAWRSGIAAEEARGEIYLRLPLDTVDSAALPDRCVTHMRREILRGRKTFTTDDSWEWEAVISPEEELVGILMELNMRRFGDASWFANALHRDFFARVCAETGEDVLFSTLRHGQDIAHIMVQYRHGDSMLYVLSGMDERFKKHSPGSMNLDRSICHAAEQGFLYFDFLRGEEAYKREFNPEERISARWTVRSGGSRMRYMVARAAQRLRRGPAENTTA